MEKKEQPSYKIVEIILMNSILNRNVNIDFTKLVIAQDTKVDSGDGTANAENKLFAVTLEVTLTGKVEEKEVFLIQTKMFGAFEKMGDSQQLPEETFRKINAPAILYPFVREHISSLATKSGVGNILLPPVNFTI